MYSIHSSPPPAYREYHDHDVESISSPDDMPSSKEAQYQAAAPLLQLEKQPERQVIKKVRFENDTVMSEMDIFEAELKMVTAPRHDQLYTATLIMYVCQLRLKA